jgi:hypothetical protein
MNLQRELRQHLRLYSRLDVRNEPICSCGAPNHARVFCFRVNGEPVTVIAPETCELSEPQLSDAVGNARVEPLPARELDSIFSDTELGRMDPFDNPFGTAVYLDESLAQAEDLVFCPKAFNNERGECFRVATRLFRERTHPIVLRLSAPAVESRQ